MSVAIEGLSQTELEALILQAQARKQELHREELGKVREEVSTFARSKGYSIEELFGKTRRGGGKRGTVPPKYANPNDPTQTWTGRGKRPRWFQAQLDSGRSESDLLIR